MYGTRTRARLVIGGALAASLAVACGPSAPEPSAEPAADQAAPAAAEPARVSHVFKGRVEAVDPAAKSLTVANENIEGWMMAMTMSYTADSDDVYATVKPGDQITATVYDGDFKTLYNVHVVESGPADAPK